MLPQTCFSNLESSSLVLFIRFHYSNCYLFPSVKILLVLAVINYRDCYVWLSICFFARHTYSFLPKLSVIYICISTMMISQAIEHNSCPPPQVLLRAWSCALFSQRIANSYRKKMNRLGSEIFCPLFNVHILPTAL